jgi:hypothetical protein
MTSERNDPPMGAKPMGTPLEPTSAASAAASSRPADPAKSAEPKTTDTKPAAAKPADAKPGASSAAASAPPSRSETKPAPPAAPRRGMGFAGVAVVALVVSAIVAAGLIVLAPRWMPMVSSAPAPDPRVAELSARLDQLAARPVGDPAQSEALRAQVAKLQEELARLSKEQDATADALAQVASEIDDIKPPQGGEGSEVFQQRLAKLEQQLADASGALERIRAMRGELDALVSELGKSADRSARLDTRLGAVEKDAAERRGVDTKAVDAARAAAVVSLGARLRQAVAQGQDGAADLAALKSLAGDDGELAAPIAALTPLAGKPLATAEALRQRFPNVAREIMTADAGDQAGSWWEKALARLQNLVSIRRTGPDVAGEDAEARVAQAEAALQAGRLDQAVAALKPLTGQAAKVAAPWLADAEALLAAQAAADKIVARGAVLLSQTTGRAPATR